MTYGMIPIRFLCERVMQEDNLHHTQSPKGSNNKQTSKILFITLNYYKNTMNQKLILWESCSSRHLLIKIEIVFLYSFEYSSFGPNNMG